MASFPPPPSETPTFYPAAEAYDRNDPKHPDWLDTVLDRVD